MGGSDKEWKAQIELFIKIAGKKPTHIDSHHHVHNMKNHREVAMKLAMEYNLPIRQDEPFDDRFEYAHFNDRFYGDNLTVDCLIDQIKMSKHEITEFMAHPAYLDQRLYEISRYNFQRMKEMEILRSEKIKSFIDENNIELINYNALSRA